MSDKLWFKAKKFGWGWTPCSWEGWTVTGLYTGIENGSRSRTEFTINGGYNPVKEPSPGPMALGRI